MKKRISFIFSRALFLILALVWFFLGFDFDNRSGDLGDSAFRALTDRYDPAFEVGAWVFSWIFVGVLVVLAIIFAVRFFTDKKSAALTAAVVEYIAVIFMLYRFSFEAGSYGNITYIPAAVLLFIIAFSDVLMLKSKQ